ncbi:MAG: Xaa-Pro peptidase family protein [Desulfobulbaceae bacterium]|nr:Xaa-Pro peptidase family protein [Desulfobulbaceae bacterium]HIJ79733.1 aminopeptidase P family protein [Deltaproteobacteria bacterium]
MRQPLKRIQTALKHRKLDCLLVTQPENRRYLSGYTVGDHSINESAGVLLIPATGEPYLLTDSRFELQAQREATGFRVKLYPRGLFPLLQKMLKSLKVKRLAFESHYFLHSTSLRLAKLADKIRIELVPLTGLVEELRLIKDEQELAKIERAVQLNELIFQEIFQGLAPGQTEKEVALKIENAMRHKGAERPSFETIVAGGPNAALPHAVPGDRPLMAGEPIIIDMGLVLDGYCSDMTRTVVLGTPDEKTVALFRLVRKAQLAGLKALKAGVSGMVVDKVARQVIERAGLGERFGHGLGHGVGLNVHEGPSLNYRNRKQLAPGMVVTVEPGIYVPDWGGIRLENMAVVTADGCRELNRDTTFLDL